MSSCGLPCAGIDVRLFDIHMQEVPAGAPGEICVRGALVMEGRVAIVLSGLNRYAGW